MNHLKIATWNANGILNHKREIELFLSQNKIDAFLISESHLTNKSYFHITGYTTYNTRHPDGRAHGGSVMLIKNNIKHHEISKYQKDYIQATSIQVTSRNKNIVISAVYCPPRHKILQYQFNEYLRTLGETYIIGGGDYNAKDTYWGPRLITPKGRELHKAIDQNKCDIITTGSPTYWPTDRNKKTCLIFFYNSRIIYILYQNSVRLQSLIGSLACYYDIK